MENYYLSLEFNIGRKSWKVKLNNDWLSDEEIEQLMGSVGDLSDEDLHSEESVEQSEEYDLSELMESVIPSNDELEEERNSLERGQDEENENEAPNEVLHLKNDPLEIAYRRIISQLRQG